MSAARSTSQVCQRTRTSSDQIHGPDHSRSICCTNQSFQAQAQHGHHGALPWLRALISKFFMFFNGIKKAFNLSCHTSPQQFCNSMSTQCVPTPRPENNSASCLPEVVHSKTLSGQHDEQQLKTKATDSGLMLCELRKQVRVNQSMSMSTTVHP